MTESELRNRAVSEARSLDIWDPVFLVREVETYALLRRYLPIAYTEHGSYGPRQQPGWFISRYDDVSEALRNTELFSSQVQITPHKLIPQEIDPPLHTSYRRTLNPSFALEAVDKIEGDIRRYADELLDEMLESEAFDFVEMFADPFPATVFCRMIGFPVADALKVVEWKNALMHGRTGHPRGALAARARAEAAGFLALDDSGNLTSECYAQVRGQLLAELFEYFDRHVESHRQAPRDDVISSLLESQFDDQRELTPQELREMLLLLFMAGLDTVSSTLAYSVQTLAAQPEKRREFSALVDDPERLASAVEELLRLHAPVTPGRSMTRAGEFRGTEIRAGDPALLSIPSANLDERTFPDPLELEFSRRPNRHLAFGLGPHRCLGIHLARLELRVGLSEFHRRLPDYALHPTRAPAAHAGLKGLGSLWLIRA